MAKKHVDGVEPRSLWEYGNGRSAGCTVMIQAEACSGWVIVERVCADGDRERVCIKARSLRPLQPQLF